MLVNNVRSRFNEKGAVATEYAVLAALIGTVITITVAAIGPRLISFLEPVISALIGSL